ADLGAEAFGHGDDRDVVGVPARALDFFADRLQVLLDAHRSATIAPNRLPSWSRRCEGSASVSLVQRSRLKTSRTPAALSCAVFCAGDGEGVGVEVQRGGEAAAGVADGFGVFGVGQAY